MKAFLRARAGQILVDERTVALVRSDRIGHIQRLELAELKGFSAPVPIFQARVPESSS